MSVLVRRLTAAVAALAIASSLTMAVPPVTTIAVHDVDLIATLQLPEGEIDFELEPGILHFFDEENAPFAVQVIDGCAVNGHLWVFGAGLAAEPATLTIYDQSSGRSHRTVLPAFEPGEPIETVFDPEALPICPDTPAGGLPTLSGTATYISATPACSDYSQSIDLLSEGRDDAYRTLVRNGYDHNRVVGRKAVAVIDQTDEWDALQLLTESRTPRYVEGVLFSGDEGMLPRQAKLEKALKGVTRGRIRRAFEWVRNERLPTLIVEDLGLKGIDCVYHVSLEFDTLGADAYLAAAGWIEEGGLPLDPPEPVEQRFTVDLVKADGESTRLPLTGPLKGSPGEGLFWEHSTDRARAVIMDACDLTGTFWAVVGAKTEEPLELVLTDTTTGTSAQHLLWTDRKDVARFADTVALESCP